MNHYGKVEYLQLFIKVLLQCRTKPTVQEVEKRQFCLTNYLYFARRNDVKFAGVWFLGSLCKPPFFCYIQTGMTGALFQYVVWWWEKIGYRSDRDARNVTGRDDTTITTVFAIDVIITIIITIIIIFIIIMSVRRFISFENCRKHCKGSHLSAHN